MPLQRRARYRDGNVLTVDVVGLEVDIRDMRKELQITNHPAIWVGFVVFLVIFYMGFVKPTSTNWGPEGYLVDRGMIAFGITLTLTYLMLFYEGTKGTDLRRWSLLRHSILRVHRLPPTCLLSQRKSRGRLL